MTKALLIIDVQNDFTEGGALAVEGGASVAANTTAFLDEHAGDYDYIIASRDWHDADNTNGGHFAAGEPDFVDTWPTHCVAGTHGADYHPALDSSRIDVHIKKGQGKPDYSIFQGTDEQGVDFRTVLNELDVEAVDVVGIATDHCVRASALDAREAGIQVRVLTDLTAGVAPDSTQTAIAEMREAGVLVV